MCCHLFPGGTIKQKKTNKIKKYLSGLSNSILHDVKDGLLLGFSLFATLFGLLAQPLVHSTNLACLLPGVHRAEAAGGAAGDHGVARPEAGVLALRYQGHLPLHAAAVRHADLLPEAEKGEH